MAYFPRIVGALEYATTDHDPATESSSHCDDECRGESDARSPRASASAAARASLISVTCRPVASARCVPDVLVVESRLR